MQNAQQLGLQHGVHLTDLVQQQRASVRCLELADATRHSAGKRTALITEELSLKQRLRDARAVDGDERTAGGRALLVDGARDQLLAGTALAVNQHRHRRLDRVAQCAKQHPHLARLSNDVAKALAAARITRRVDGAKRLFDGSGQPRDERGLVDELKRAVLHRVQRQVHGAVPCQEDDRTRGRQSLQLLEDGRPIDVG